jgi:hypothetical protein
MTILFDENVPAPLRKHLEPHQVTTVQEQGWAGISNGDLVLRTNGVFDVLLLADKNLRYQQNLANRQVALVELPTNRWPALQMMLPRIRQAVNAATPGSYTSIELPASRNDNYHLPTGDSYSSP